MKNIILPKTSENSIDLSRITPNSKGIIIAYKENNIIGYILYYDGEWTFVDNINFENEVESNYNLAELLEHLINKRYTDSFKFMEFK